MNVVTRFPDRRAIEREASDWLAKLDRDEPPSKEELEALREWLHRSPAHRQALRNLNAFWSNNILTELVVPLGRHDVRAERPATLRRQLLRPAALAAVAASIVLASVLVLRFGHDPFAATNGLYLTAVGHQQKVDLADGSTLQLNTNSQVQVEYNDRYRNIRLLRGEAYFEVATNPRLPFRVYAGDSRIQAMGTAFIVSVARNDAIEVLVTEGRVALASLDVSQSTGDAAGSRAASARAGADAADFDPYVKNSLHDLGHIEAAQSVTLDASAATRDAQNLAGLIKEVDVEARDRRQSWRKGLLIFAGEPLERVIQEVSRYTTVSIEIADPELRAIQIGGRFRTGEIEEMLAALEANFRLEAHWLSDNRVQLKASHDKSSSSAGTETQSM